MEGAGVEVDVGQTQGEEERGGAKRKKERKRETRAEMVYGKDGACGGRYLLGQPA